MLFWLWFFGSIAVVVLFWKKILAKLLLVGMVLALVLSILPMAIPFYALLFSTTSFGLLLNIDLNKKYRAQIVGYSIMVHPVLQVIEKRGLLEQQVFQCSDSDLPNNNPDVKIRDAKEVVFVKETDSIVTLALSYNGSKKILLFDKAKRNIIKK